MPSLLIIKGEQREKSVCFRTYATIGRSSRCTLSVKDLKLSRVHCEIIEDQGDFVLIDLHSQNGTNLNGQPVTEKILQDGDIFAIGKSEIAFYFSDTPNTSSQLPKYKPIATKKIGPQDVTA